MLFSNLFNKKNEVIEKLDKLHDDWQEGEEAWRIFLQRYFLACARAIWKLLPDEMSRRGIEVTEQFLLGLATPDDMSRADYESEAAAFGIDYNTNPAEVERWEDEIKRIPRGELKELIHPIGSAGKYKPREILLYAAYFANFAMNYTNFVNLDGTKRTARVPENYWIFLSPKVLKEFLLM